MEGAVPDGGTPADDGMLQTKIKSLCNCWTNMATPEFPYSVFPREAIYSPRCAIDMRKYLKRIGNKELNKIFCRVHLVVVDRRLVSCVQHKLIADYLPGCLLGNWNQDQLCVCVHPSGLRSEECVFLGGEITEQSINYYK